MQAGYGNVWLRTNELTMKTKLIFILCMICTSIAVHGGGGWPIGKRKAYFKLGQNWIVASRFYNPAGEIISIRTTGLYTTSLYGEYGFTDRLTGIVYFPFFVRGILNEERFSPSGKVVTGESVNSIGDTDIGLKYSFLVNKPVVLSATLAIGLPVGKTDGGASGILQTGDGEFNQSLRIDASTSFYPRPAYASVYIALNNRTENFSDEFRYGVEVGYTFFKKLTTIVKINAVKSLFNGAEHVADNGIFSNNTEYISPALELGYQCTEKIGVSAFGGFAFSGRNILASPNWGVGVYLKLQ
jgi:protein XagA